MAPVFYMLGMGRYEGVSHFVSSFSLPLLIIPCICEHRPGFCVCGCRALLCVGTRRAFSLSCLQGSLVRGNMEPCFVLMVACVSCAREHGALFPCRACRCYSDMGTYFAVFTLWLQISFAHGNIEVCFFCMVAPIREFLQPSGDVEA